MSKDLPTCCYHCVVDGTVTSWPKEAIPVLCERHQAMTQTCTICEGTGGNNYDCAACVGSGHILTDPVLWAAELLALEYRKEATRHGENWLAYLLIVSAEQRKWDFEEWVEAHRGMAMMTQPGGPWEGKHFAYRASEAIIAAISQQMRKEVRADELSTPTALES